MFNWFLKAFEKAGHIALPYELKEKKRCKMLTKFGNSVPEGKTRVKILRGYQDYTIGSVVDLPTKDIDYLKGRKVVEEVKIEKEEDSLDPKEKEIREKLYNETQTRVIEPQQNRAIGLEKSPKVSAKRKSKPRKKKA